MIVILNDNKMSIADNVGAMSKYLKNLSNTSHDKRDMKTIFSELGFKYFGPVDGHNIADLITVLDQAKHTKGPIFIHCKTKKGKGYEHAENNNEKFHGISAFDIENGTKLKSSKIKTYTNVFSDTLIKLAKKNKRIVAITAAMPDGTGLANFGKQFPDRFFDVGIAEQHAVTFAAGLAAQGLKPVVAIYSTFLQRAYDQLVHDVCLQNLPVVFAIDRAGLVGEDGATHHGNFDLSYLRTMPNMVIMAPKDEEELQHMLLTAIKHRGPIAIRYPRGVGLGKKLSERLRKIKIGQSEIIQEGKDVLFLAIGNTVDSAIRASRVLKTQGISVEVINARFVKPIDKKILHEIRKIQKVLVIEENSIIGGFGSAILEEIHKHNIKAEVKQIGIPDEVIHHGSQDVLRRITGLNKINIILQTKALLK